MTEELALSIGMETLKTILLIAGPLLVAAMTVGILVSVIQAITQINEATLTFIPKMLAVVLVTALLAPWMMKILQEYTTVILGSAGEWVR